MSRLPTPEKIFDCLIGKWRINRIVPAHANMMGEAIFERRDPDAAIYYEAVSLKLPQGVTLEGEQSYLYRRLPRGFAIYFEKTGELFESVEFSLREGVGLIATAKHFCAADTYDSVYHFSSVDRFEIHHKVFGPRKNYEIGTVYTRMNS